MREWFRQAVSDSAANCKDNSLLFLLVFHHNLWIVKPRFILFYGAFQVMGKGIAVNAAPMNLVPIEYRLVCRIVWRRNNSTFLVEIFKTERLENKSKIRVAFT